METAYRRMRDQRIRHLPVHNESGQIVGVLSDRDVQRAMIVTNSRDEDMGIPLETTEFDPEARVRDFMSWPVKYVDHEASLGLVAERMVIEKVSSVLVRQGAEAVGIITAEDLLKVLIDLLKDPKTPDLSNTLV